MLCNCICVLTGLYEAYSPGFCTKRLKVGLYDKTHKNHKETEHMQSNT